MKHILVVSGSRADYGLLEWPVKVLREDGGFNVSVREIWGASPDTAYVEISAELVRSRPDFMLILGDRYEILAAALAAHLARVPIAHIGGGDVSEGSYDDAMRDCISRLASIHFVTSTSAMARLTGSGYRPIHLVGNPGVDYIRHAQWRKERPIADPYVVVSYQPETIDGHIDVDALREAIGTRKAVIFYPNPDRGSEELRLRLDKLRAPGDMVYEAMEHGEFLNLLAHCEEFIGNSSAMLYEAPELGIRTRMIGKRQRGRTIPWGDGQASLRIANILRYTQP